MAAALLTYRRDHREYKNLTKIGKGSCPDQLIGGIIFCGSYEGREAWIRRLNQSHPSRFNHFVCFVDVESPYALQFGFAEWASPNHPYVCR
jgi:hypothetical protein